MENTKRKNQRGAMMVFFAILLPFLFGLMGLAIDASVLYLQRGKLQDVADAAALAGAAHLGDEERQEGVEKAVSAYVKGNGINVNSNSMKDLADTSAPAQKGDTYVKWGIVNVDGVDRVRVRITQRVPVYFVSVLLEDYRNGVNVTSVAAATGEVGEVVASGGAKIMCDLYTTGGSHHSGSSIKVDKKYDFSVYAGNSDIDGSKFPKGTGTLYASKVYNDEKFDYDRLISTTNSPEPNDKQKEQLEEVKNIFEEKKVYYKNAVNREVANVESYKRGEGNKRYIERGFNNIKEDDEVIDLYIAGCEEMINNTGFILLTDRALKKVTMVNKLIFPPEKTGIVLTSNKIYGDILSAGWAIDIEGTKNYINGVVYCPDKTYLMGKNNCFWSDPVNSGYGIICHQLFMGAGYNVTINEGSDANLKMEYANFNWNIRFGKGDDDDDDDDDDDKPSPGTTSKLRLVE